MRPALFAFLALVVTLLVPHVVAAADPLPQHAGALPPVASGRSLGAAVGSAPDAEHPRGTIFVAAPLASCGAAIVEWDLATSRSVRTACLGLPAGSMHVARAGAMLYVVREGYAGASEARTLATMEIPSLRVVRRIGLPSGGTSGIATDGTLVAVASGGGLEPRRWSLTTLDTAGNVLGRSESAGELGMPEASVAVLGGNVYVGLAASGGVRPRLVLLDSRATLVRQIAVEVSDSSVWLGVKGGAILVAGGSELLEVSSRLDVLARHPVSAQGKVAVSPDGRVLTGYGDEVFTDTLTLERTLPWGGHMHWVHDVLWSGTTAVEVTSEPTGGGPAVVTWVALP